MHLIYKANSFVQWNWPYKQDGLIPEHYCCTTWPQSGPPMNWPYKRVALYWPEQDFSGINLMICCPLSSSPSLDQRARTRISNQKHLHLQMLRHLPRVRRLPYMTSAQRDGGQKIPQICNKQYIKFGQRGEGKAKKSEKFADIIYGSPLTPFHHAQVGKNNNFPYSWCIPPSLPWHWQKHRYMVTWWNLKMFRYIGYWM